MSKALKPEADDDEQMYNKYYRKGKKLFKENKIAESLKWLRRAFAIRPSEELQTKMNKIENLVEAGDSEGGSDDDEKQEGRKGAVEERLRRLVDERRYKETKDYERLYGYQREGVDWLVTLWGRGQGAVLADDMGLGKTVQIIFYLRQLFEHELIESVLVVVPKSLLINWAREIEKWAPDLTPLFYSENNKERNLRKVQARGGVLLATYGTVVNSWQELNKDSKYKWSVLVLDEGHKIKNPSSRTFKAINALRARQRLVLTGTAVQNNLKELWALLDFTHQGGLLGTYPTFSREFEKPITASRKKDASTSDKHYGEEIALSLKKIIRPFFLRRTKEEVTRAAGPGGSVPRLSRKNDLIIWLPMTADQISIYQKFLEHNETKILLMRTEKRSPLLELNVLKKICDHPRLLSPDQCAELGMARASTLRDLPIAALMAESGKMAFLVRLVLQLAAERRKALVFSQSKVVLSIIQRILESHRVAQLRLDGDVLRPEDRQAIVDRFNTDPACQVLLLTSQVGGVGLTLTGAERVVIYDSNWNPSVDAQSVDRVYRIGQQRDVVVYRLITCGTVEEKIYRRQIFKDSLNRATTGVKKTDDNSYRYFTQSELFELFTLSDPLRSETQLQLHDMHAHQRRYGPYLEEHSRWLARQGAFGISDHDLLFSQEDERVQVDCETAHQLAAKRQLAESALASETEHKMTEDEMEMRRLMNNLTIEDKRPRSRARQAPEGVFIPSKSHLTRFVPSQPAARQTTMDRFLTRQSPPAVVDLTSASDVVEISDSGESEQEQDEEEQGDKSTECSETDDGGEEQNQEQDQDQNEEGQEEEQEEQEEGEEEQGDKSTECSETDDGGEELEEHGGAASRSIERSPSADYLDEEPEEQDQDSDQYEQSDDDDGDDKENRPGQREAQLVGKSSSPSFSDHRSIQDSAQGERDRPQDLDESADILDETASSFNSTC